MWEPVPNIVYYYNSIYQNGSGKTLKQGSSYSRNPSTSPEDGKSYAREQENLTLNTEIIRRIVNISGDPEDSIRLEIMDEYAIKVRHSDHSLEQTRTIIKYYIE